MLNAGGLLGPDKWVGLSGFGLRVQANLHLILKHQDVPREKGEETRLRTTRTNREQLFTISFQLLQEYVKASQHCTVGPCYLSLHLLYSKLFTGSMYVAIDQLLIE